MAFYRLGDKTPRIDPTAWVAETATVIGDVILGPDASIWFGTVVRGDNVTLTIGRGSNVQDNCMVHADAGQPTTLGEDVSVGHQAVLHGCTVGDGSLIGIGAVLLNGSRIGRNCLVGARALVTENKTFPDGSLIVGSPAVVVRTLTPEQIANLLRNARHYVDNAARYRAGFARIG